MTELYELRELTPRASCRSRKRASAIAAVRGYIRDRTAPYFVGNRRQAEVEVQVLALGRAVLLALPLEPTTRASASTGARVSARPGARRW